jgi:hypothetical protein
MIREILGGIACLVLLYCLPWLIWGAAHASIWADHCGAGVMIDGAGGYYLQWGACHE